MTSPVAFSPYDYQIHEDPYPVYARLRDEAPLYRNTGLDFWALSRHQDVVGAFRDPSRFSSASAMSRIWDLVVVRAERHGRGQGFSP